MLNRRDVVYKGGRVHLSDRFGVLCESISNGFMAFFSFPPVFYTFDNASKVALLIWISERYFGSEIVVYLMDL